MATLITPGVGIDFAAARTFGGDPKATGVSGIAPNEGHAAISSDLAEMLAVRLGDFIDVNAYGNRNGHGCAQTYADAQAAADASSTGALIGLLKAETRDQPREFPPPGFHR